MDLEKIKEEIKEDIESIKNSNFLSEIKAKYFGKNGKITNLRNEFKNLSVEEKKEYGKRINNISEYFTNLYDNKAAEIEKTILEEKLKSEAIDVTLPEVNIPTGAMHPITKIKYELEDLFISMGYDVVTGPEVEDDLHCFEMLNLPKNHPARDAQDTFYITDEILLRTQTSAMQARFMEKEENHKPFRIIVPGKTYRRDDDDATHSHQFTQMEGLVIGENISLADLKGTLEEFANKMFGENTTVRFRPSYFPFTEPSYEVDISCFKCGGKGCNLCKNTGFIEILGSGMVHPNVLTSCGIDPKKYQGFAFGIGLERVAMLKYGINNIRDFYTNDIRFIDNFNRIEGGNNNETI